MQESSFAFTLGENCTYIMATTKHNRGDKMKGNKPKCKWPMDTLFSFIFLSLRWESSIVLIIKTLFNFFKAGGEEIMLHVHHLKFNMFNLWHITF